MKELEKMRKVREEAGYHIGLKGNLCPPQPLDHIPPDLRQSFQGVVAFGEANATKTSSIITPYVVNGEYLIDNRLNPPDSRSARWL